MPPKQARAGRRHGIPPAPPQRLPFDALEARKDPIDLALWHSLRCVLLWSRTQEYRRARLFRRVGETVRARIGAAADAAPLLADPLAALLRLQEQPGAADPATVAVA